MREYEMVREILNSCPNNQMRDIYISNVRTDDPEAYVRTLVKGSDVMISREELSDGSTVFHTDCAGLLQVFTFTPDD